jgi:UDP-N-acetylmuramyl-tripeptide synthetase
MTVRQLVHGLAGHQVQGDDRRFVSDLVANHLEVSPDSAFVAMRGARFDGHAFVREAIERGARTLVVETPRPATDAVTWVCVQDTRRALAVLAANFFRRPFDRMTLIGITGTNGKTSTAHLVQHLFQAHATGCTRLGTVGHEVAGNPVEATTTTPDALELNRLLRRALDEGDQAAVMEVSSHALCTHRVEEVAFDAAVWTNLTQDHLDFHGTMDAYLAAKLRLFRQLKPDGVAVLNRDDPAFPAFAAVVRERSDVRLLAYGFHGGADLRAEDVAATPHETAFTLIWEASRVRIRLRLLGDYNVANALAALGAGIGLGLSADELKHGVESLVSVPGRFEPVVAGQPFSVVVDYAHTPDALERLLRAARALRPRRLLVVFGCGGDRDRTKRPLMGRIAADLADVVVVTSDNPRTEDPQAIIREIEGGIPQGRPYDAVVDRDAAIRHAVSLAQPGDMVVIAGKGHEPYQILGTTRIHFDDREVARKHLQGYDVGGLRA